MTLQQLVTRLGIPLASMHRLLGALGDEGLVVRSPATRRYVIGPTIHRLATGWKTRSDVAEVARPHLERLRHDLSETAFVSQLVGDKVICVALAESTHRLRLFVRVGQEMPLHATAAARAILAYRRPPFARAALSARRLQAFTGRTPTDVQAIIGQLSRIRERGYDTCEDEIDQGVWAVAAPIGGPAGEVDASVSVAGPAHRLADSATRRLGSRRSAPSRRPRVRSTPIWVWPRPTVRIACSPPRRTIAPARNETTSVPSYPRCDHYHADLDPLLGHVTYLDVEAEAVEREVARGDVAVLFIEVVQGGGPVVPLPAEVLRRWCRDARHAGVAVVADEIQTGLWRCGPFSLALDLGLELDAVLFSKALGGGVMPLSAALCRSSLLAPLEQSPYLHSQTFSGHPLACAAGVAALDALPVAVKAHAARVGRDLAAMLERVATYHEVVAGVHHLGLMGSIDFGTAHLAQQFVIGAARNGLLLWPCDGAPTVVRVLPPLVATTAETERAAAILDRQCALSRSREGHPAVVSPTTIGPA